MRMLCLGAILALLGSMVPVLAQAVVPTVVTVEGQYLGLSSGPLRQAVLVTLPPGTVLRAGDVVISAQQVRDSIKQARPELQSGLTNNQFYVMEQQAVPLLMLAEAHAWAKTTGRTTAGESTDSLLRAYEQSLTADVTVSDAELRQFYQENKDLFGNAPFNTVQTELRSVVQGQKRRDVLSAHIANLSARRPVEVDATWTKTQAATALDNPLDRARRAGVPLLVDFGRGGCQACDMMTPMLESLRQEAAGRYTVLFMHTGENPILAMRYGIESIPAQVIFDKHGREVYRHVGFIPKAQLQAQLAAVGVQ